MWHRLTFEVLLKSIYAGDFKIERPKSNRFRSFFVQVFHPPTKKKIEIRKILVKKSNKIILSALTASTLILLAACGKSATSRNIQFGLPSDITTLDSSMVTDVFSQEVIGSTEEGLMRNGANNQPQLALAKSICVSNDGLTYTIILKDNLKYSNGTKLTASDFVYNFERANDPKTGAQYNYLFTNVLKNTAQVQAGKLPVSALGIKAVSADKLVITLVKPTPYFKFLLTEPITYPLNQKFVESQGKKYGTTSVTTLYDGPYEFSKTKGFTGTNKNFSIVKNPNYYDAGAVKSNEIDFQVVNNLNTGAELFKTVKLDFAMINTTDLVKANENTKGYSVIHPSETQFLQYNQTGSNKALANADIREALNLATNRSEIVQEFEPASTVATSIISKGMYTTTSGQDFASLAKQNYTYNTALAKQLFEKGVKTLGLSKLTLSIEAPNDNQEADNQLVRYLQTSYEKALPGLTINQKLVPFQQQLNDLSVHNFDIALSSWGADYAEPTTFFNLFTTGSAGNMGGFSNTTFDKAFAAATNLPDVLNASKRDADYENAEHALYTQSNINPISYGSFPTLTNPSLQGFEVHSAGLPFDLKTAYLKQ